MDSMQHYIIASSNPSQKDKDRNLKQSLYDASSALLLYRKLRRISYKAKSAPRGSHCGGTEFVASRPAAGGESCSAGFYFYFSGTTTVIDSTGKPAAYACRVMRPEPVKRRMTEARP